MFWGIHSFSSPSPVESILDKESFSLEELLDEEDIIQECKALNTRLINFLRDRAQVEQLLRYIVEDAPEDAESKQIFKFPFIACEIFTCEIDVILKSLVEDAELMDLLFSFLEPNRAHNSLSAGYFSKVVVCLMLRKTTSLMKYVQTHEGLFRQLVDLIGITSIMEVLVRLVGADDHMHPNFLDVMQWLASSDLLEMIVDKLHPSSSPQVQANAAEVLWAIIRNSPSVLAAKLASPSFIERIFGHALAGSVSKSALVHSLSVCIALVNPKLSASHALVHSIRSQHLYEPSIPVDSQTILAMLPRLGDLLKLLDISLDEELLKTTYGELRPPLGIHRLKIVEFIAVLLGTGDEDVENELVRSGAIRRILDLFFEYPFNNSLHHHVENIIISCMESKNVVVLDHLFCECEIIEKLVSADKNPILSTDTTPLTLAAAGRQPPRAGYIGHITRIANKLIQLGSDNDHIRAYLQKSNKWMAWQANTLSGRNSLENVCRWACGRPASLQERIRDSDEEELQDRDYDVTTLADNLSQALRYCVYQNDDADEVHGSVDRDDEDAYFNDESAEVVISSLRLGDDHERRLFTNSNWFAFRDDRVSEDLSTSTLDRMHDISLDETPSGGSDSKTMDDNTRNGFMSVQMDAEKSSVVDDLALFQFETRESDDLFNDQQLPDWVGWREPSDILVDESYNDSSTPDSVEPASGGCLATASMSESGELEETRGPTASLFEEDAEFVGVDMEATVEEAKQPVEEDINEEPKAQVKSSVPKLPEVRKSCEDVIAIMEFNDMSHWRVEPEVGVVQE